jgi:ribosomal protein L7/L12
MPQVLILGWRPGLKSVSLIKLLQERTDYSLRMAKEIVDRCLEGETVEVEVATLTEAERLAHEADALGAITEVKE